ncbi:MAG TPA: glutathione S-transferase family protein [Gaiellales bacterium]
MRLYDYEASGNCYKVRLLLALTGTPYERVPIDIFAGDTLGDGYARLNPVRETPVLELDDGSLVTQSNAILWLLAQGTPYLPDDAVGTAHALEWMFFEQERVMPGVGGVRFRRLTGRPVPPGRSELGRDALAVLDAHLRDRAFLVGPRCSLADISLFGYTHVAHDAGFALGAFPAVAAWLERVTREPGFVNDLAPYPPNAREGAGTSIYDA